MNIFGHLKTIKELVKRKEFWEAVAEQAADKDFKTEYRISLNFASGESKKIKWHREQIIKLKGGVTKDGRRQQNFKKL